MRRLNAMGPRVAALPTGFDNFLFVADNLRFDVKAFASISLEVFFDRPVPGPTG